MSGIAHLIKYWPMVTVYSVSHFLVDFACAFLMFRYMSSVPEAALCVLLYNFCAFALQMPLGLIADKVNKNYLFAISGCILVASAFLFVPYAVPAVLIIGVGNALFHLGGGIDVLNISKKKLSALGIFVSPGAFGIYLGTLLGKGSEMPAPFFPLVLVAAAGVIFFTHQTRKENFLDNSPLSLEGAGSRVVLIAAICFFLVVCLRSYVGLSLDFGWKSVGLWGIALIGAVVFGKVLGGFVADRFGIMRTSCISLGVSALLFLFPDLPIAGVIAVLLFNMTMPITLWALAKMIPGAKGFAFGLLTFGLFLGFLPVYLGLPAPFPDTWSFTLFAAVSLVLLMLGLRGVKQ